MTPPAAPVLASPDVLIEEHRTASGHLIAHARLNRPGSLNALSFDACRILLERVRAWQADPAVALIVIDGTGDRAMCAGGDVVALYRACQEAEAGVAPDIAFDYFGYEYHLDFLIHTSPKPVLVWGHGIIMGGGVGLFAGASHRVVTAQTRFAMPEISIGLFPDVGGSWFLPRLPGRIGLFLALTGTPLKAADLRCIGLADFLCAHSRRDAVLADLAASPWHDDPPENHAALSRLLQRHAPLEADPDSAIASPELMPRLTEIERLIGLEGLPQAAARLRACAADPAADPWLAAAARTFAHGCPTTAALAWTLQARLRHASLADVFRTEFHVAVQCCARRDFAEGVRALLIDKDRNPRWQPATLEEVTIQHIDAHFLPADSQRPHPLQHL